MRKTALAIVALGAALATSSPTYARSSSACHQSGKDYINVDGQDVSGPRCGKGHMAGETAICRDGSHSFSKHHAGTCSGHGGVAEWE